MAHYKKSMKILGIDPGTNITGFGIITNNKLNFTYIGSGCIKTKGNLYEKITIIVNNVNEIINKYVPDILVLERVFMRPDRPNPDAAIKLGHARGAIMAAAGLHKINIIEYSPNQIKKTITGRGRASKTQVSFMVNQLLKLEKTPQVDASDALACALCYAYHNI